MSDGLTLKQARNIIEAAQSAAPIGLPLNRHWTVQWKLCGIPDGKAAAATGQLLKLASDWLAKRGKRFAYAWVRENDTGDGSKGSHVHILMHVPAGMSLGLMQRRWLKRVTGARYRKGAIHTARIGGTAGAAGTAPNLYRANLEAVVGYVLKGALPETARGLEGVLSVPKKGPQGRVTGKRVGTSQNIGPAARARRFAKLAESCNATSG